MDRDFLGAYGLNYSGGRRGGGEVVVQVGEKAQS